MEKTTINASLDDLLFENGNKEYGAYELRRNENRNLLNGLYISTSLLVGICLAFWTGQLLANTAEEPMSPEPPRETTYTVPLTKTEPEPDPEKPKMEDKKAETPKVTEPEPPALGIDQAAHLIPKPDPNASATATVANVDSLKDKNPGFTDQKALAPGGIIGGDPNGNPGGNPGGEKPGGNGQDTMAVDKPTWDDIEVDQLPYAENMNDIKKAIGYPDMARNAGIEGDINFRVLVGKDGSIEQYKITKSTHPVFQKACEKQIGKLHFQPGKVKEKPVRVWVNVPFRFRLSK